MSNNVKEFGNILLEQYFSTLEKHAWYYFLIIIRYLAVNKINISKTRMKNHVYSIDYKTISIYVTNTITKLPCVMR